MAYDLLTVPIRGKFSEASKGDLKAYFEWFMDVIPKRISALEELVRQEPKFCTWRADFSVDSLDALGGWFASNISVRPRTPAELEELSRGPAGLLPPPPELTDRTLSISSDVGMYLGEVFTRRFSGLRWTQTFGSKRSIDYGQVCIAGFGSDTFSAIRMVNTLAYGIAAGKRDGRGLRDLYDVWAQLVK